MTVYEKMLRVQAEKGAGYFVLLDPDKMDLKGLIELAATCETGGVDALLVGGSVLFLSDFDGLVRELKSAVSLPIVLFPGSGRQLSRYADAVLFLSMISGRNPHYLIGEQVLAAPAIHALGLEAISTGYMLVQSGKMTSAEFMSHTTPIPRDKAEIAVAHALAASYLGMKWVYLEAGSGAELTVPLEMIAAVRRHVPIPVIVGGGIRSPEEAEQKVKAGASFIVTGNILEKSPAMVGEFASAVHVRS